MQPRRLFTTIRLNGITLDCKNGISFQFNSKDKVDGFDTTVKMKIFKLISDNMDIFMNSDGVDLFVEIDRLPETSYVVDVLTILKDEEDEDADGEEDHEEDTDEEDEDKEDADGGISSFCELISGLFDKKDDADADGEEDDWDDDWDDWGE